MYREKDSMTGQLVLYPNVKASNFNRSRTPSVVISPTSKSVNLLHRRIDGNDKWQMVQFASMDRVEFQKYIDAMQEICDNLEGTQPDNQGVLSSLHGRELVTL